MEITRRGFLKALSGLVAAASLPAISGDTVVKKIESENVTLNVTKQWIPMYQAWVYEFSSKTGNNHFYYNELVSDEMNEKRFEQFKEMALIQIEKYKSKLATL